MGVPYTGQMLTGRYADNKKRGCEKMFNHFFTASFLCILSWLYFG